jgi:hydroxymethylglutaryl-CoA reductase (NADPH)
MRRTTAGTISADGADAQTRHRVPGRVALTQGFLHLANATRMMKEALAAVARPALGEEGSGRVCAPFAELIPRATLSADASEAGTQPGGRSACRGKPDASSGVWRRRRSGDHGIVQECQGRIVRPGSPAARGGPMQKLPPTMLSRLYAFGSLASVDGSFHFALENQLGEATLTRVIRLVVDGTDLPLERVEIELADGARVLASAVTPGRPAVLPLRERTVVRALGGTLALGPHRLDLVVEMTPYGAVELEMADAIAPRLAATPGATVAATASPAALSPAAASPPRRPVPYDKDPVRDCTPERVAERQRFVAEVSGVELDHVARFAFDPSVVRGNIESFTGVAQVPLGFAGPLRVNGEYARGDFLIPLATTEGTLVASYGRGMKVVSLAGGVTCTVSSDAMQRAPVFGFDSAREARAFRDWVAAHLPEIRAAAESTSHVARLIDVQPFLASRFAYLRFGYETGEAAGQNMVGRATLAACEWILASAVGVRHFYLESNLAPDKKPSHVNMLHPRGKHVTAEVTLPRELLREHLHVEPGMLLRHGQAATLAELMGGVGSNGLHTPNAVAAMFIATGQDVANVAEASNTLVSAEPTDAGDLYLSLTIPSLIVATHGGGTGLPTQRECLEVLGCYGKGKVNKLAEIVAGSVLAGELSLAAAISSSDWVSSHEQYGRNR